MKLAYSVFVRVDSPTVHQFFFFRPTGGELRQLNAMLRVTLMSSLHDNGDRRVQLLTGVISTMKFIYGESIIFQAFELLRVSCYQYVCEHLFV